MFSNRRLLFLLAASLLLSCSKAPAPEMVVEAPAQPVVIQVGLTPALAQFEEALYACSTEVSVLAEVLPWQRLQQEPKDVVLVYGEEGKTLSDFVYQIGESPLAFIVHPSLPFDDITVEQAQAIYQGTLSDWNDINLISAYSGLIQPWGYMEGTEIMAVVMAAFGITNPTGQWYVVPSPVEMIAKVSAEQNAIGIVPGFAVSAQVRGLTITDETLPPIPILAVWSDELSQAEQDWLLCVQEALP